uniref:Uncharacterized protein n=1 Tax=Myoviridae sp. ctshb19 TaxID=2825194 RepID=A0A8S5UGC3_9CAUD|nr:MAG TPA: hypothetical protein [Myoviridae sp. ctshb19]
MRTGTCASKTGPLRSSAFWLVLWWPSLCFTGRCSGRHQT